MPQYLSGFEALSALSYLFSNNTDLSSGVVVGTDTLMHPALARGNSKAAQQNMSEVMQVGGIIHGTLRNLTASVGNLVDTTALNPDQRAFFLQRKKLQESFRADIRALEKLCPPDFKYSSFAALEDEADRENPQMAKPLLESIAVIRRNYVANKRNLNKVMNDEPKLPLVFKDMNGQACKGSVSNVNGLWDLLLFMGEARLGLLDDAAVPTTLPNHMPVTSDISVKLRDRLFSQLIYANDPDTKALSEALSQHLAQKVKDCLEKLDEKFGASLGNTHPNMYKSIIELKQNLSPSAEIFSGLPSAKETVEDAGPAETADASKCPYRIARMQPKPPEAQAARPKHWCEEVMESLGNVPSALGAHWR